MQILKPHQAIFCSFNYPGVGAFFLPAKLNLFTADTSFPFATMTHVAAGWYHVFLPPSVLQTQQPQCLELLQKLCFKWKSCGSILRPLQLFPTFPEAWCTKLDVKLPSGTYQHPLEQNHNFIWFTFSKEQKIFFHSHSACCQQLTSFLSYMVMCNIQPQPQHMILIPFKLYPVLLCLEGRMICFQLECVSQSGLMCTCKFQKASLFLSAIPVLHMKCLVKKSIVDLVS